MLVFEPRGNTLVRLTRPTRTHPLETDAFPTFSAPRGADADRPLPPFDPRLISFRPAFSLGNQPLPGFLLSLSFSRSSSRISPR